MEKHRTSHNHHSSGRSIGRIAKSYRDKPSYVRFLREPPLLTAADLYVRHQRNMAKESTIEFTRSALANADGLVRWAIALNGAAAAGLLTFLGGTIDKQALFHNWSLFGSSLLLFSAGLCVGLICSLTKLLALNFLAQIHDPPDDATKEELEIYLKVGDRAAIFGLVSLAALFLALGLFAAGTYVGKVAIFGGGG